jgi:cyclopropane fatty-acyl-phospholipid synthase-like methyltransferase
MPGNWDVKYADATEPGRPAEVLAENLHLLPGSGRALDVACGLGANALQLARCNLDVDAWDSSAVAIRKLRSFATDQGLVVKTTTSDISALLTVGYRWDVIVIAHFLDRSFCARVPEILNSGGLVFYQTFTRTKVDNNGPVNPDFLLGENELLTLFPTFTIRYFRDEGLLGNTLKGKRGKSFLVAQKRS